MVCELEGVCVRREDQDTRTDEDYAVMYISQWFPAPLLIRHELDVGVS
jgi:hypothetical protein